jgi:hypothetical protein
MGEPETEEEGCDERSGDEGQSEECLEVMVVEASGASASSKPILRLPERNDDDTVWTRDDDNRSVCGRNKVKTEDITRVRKRKEMLSKEVAKCE